MDGETKENETLREQIRSLEEANKAQGQERKELEKRIKKLEGEKSQLESRISKQEDKDKQLNDNLKELDSRLKGEEREGLANLFSLNIFLVKQNLIKRVRIGKEEDHMNEDHYDPTSLVNIKKNKHPQSPSSPLALFVTQQNGDIVTLAEASTDDFASNFEGNFDVNLQEDEAAEHEDLLFTAGLVDPNLKSSYSETSQCIKVDCLHPDVTSLCSSVYDSLPCESQHESCRIPSPFRSDDQISMTSLQSDSLKAYSKNLACSLLNNTTKYNQSGETQPLIFCQGSNRQALQPFNTNGYQFLAHSPLPQQMHNSSQQDQQSQEELKAAILQATFMPTTVSSGGHYLERRYTHSLAEGTSGTYGTLGSRVRRVTSSKGEGHYQQVPLSDISQKSEDFQIVDPKTPFLDQHLQIRRSSFHGYASHAIVGRDENRKTPKDTLHPQELTSATYCSVHNNDTHSGPTGPSFSQYPHHEGGGLRVTFATPEVSTSFADTPENEDKLSDLLSTKSCLMIPSRCSQEEINSDGNVAL
ncbi:hypothetical protein SK128_015565 [Halocaridina rubra]|uniref:Uncharacterized protein n=1 Tax=Halocaridina rubra TaxID=373956 RepID=A0AAN9ABP7_HALRR